MRAYQRFHERGVARKAGVSEVDAGFEACLVSALVKVVGEGRELAVGLGERTLVAELPADDAGRLEAFARGEIVVVIAPPQTPAEMGAAESEGLLRDALARLSLKDAVAEVAQLTGKRRREVYQSALALQKSAKKKDAEHGAPR